MRCPNTMPRGAWAGIVLAVGAALPSLADEQVTIQNFEFVSATVTIEVGEKVTWTNLDGLRHTVTSQSGPNMGVPSGLFGSPLLNSNQTFEVTFNAAGEFHYFCTPHGIAMQGVVVVEGGCEPDLTAGAVPGQPGYGIPNGILNNDDFFYYLSQFAAGNVAVADMTTGAVPGQPGYGVPNGIINNEDFFYYLAIFAAGCGESVGGGGGEPKAPVKAQGEAGDLLILMAEAEEHRACCREHQARR